MDEGSGAEAETAAARGGEWQTMADAAMTEDNG